MNKTVSINLGGLFFHIDENAYQKLNNYFDAIRKSLSPDGREEIMNDIEGRIAELLTEKLKSDKQVVGLNEIDEIITIMGEPEDYRLDEEEGPKATYTAPGAGYIYTRSRKFYRDGDKAIIAGVCAGIGHYFRLDPLWVRILFIISPFISFGTSIIIYVLLWILIPKAITTTEKLEMTGEPINISNIEKKVKEEIDGITSRLNNIDYEKINANAKSGIEKAGNALGNVFSALFKGIAKVIGALLTVFAALSLGGIIITFFVMLFSSAVNAPWFMEASLENFTDIPIWLIALLGLFAIGIPVFFLFLLGLKILSENLKPIGNITKYTLLAVWLIAVGLSVYLGIRQAAEVSYEGRTLETKEIALSKSDTLNIKFRYNENFARSLNSYNRFRFKQDSEGNTVIYSNSLRFYVMKTDKPQPYVQIEKTAMGASLSDARERAENIKYTFDIEGNTLILDNYLLTGIHNKFRDQRVAVYLYLPKGYYIHPDSSVQDYDDTDNEFFDLWYDTDKHIYLMGEDRVECLDCIGENNNSGEDNDNVDFEISSNDGSKYMKISTSGDKVFKVENGDTIYYTREDNVDIDLKADKNGMKLKVRSNDNQ